MYGLIAFYPYIFSVSLIINIICFWQCKSFVAVIAAYDMCLFALRFRFIFTKKNMNNFYCICATHTVR